MKPIRLITKTCQRNGLNKNIRDTSISPECRLFSEETKMTCLISMTSIKSIKSMTAMPHWLDSIIKQTTPFHDQGIGILITGLS